MIAIAPTLQPVTIAYLDPGTGSLVIQVLIGFAVGSLAAIKVYWSRIAGVFRRLRRKEKP